MARIVKPKPNDESSEFVPEIPAIAGEEMESIGFQRFKFRLPGEYICGEYAGKQERPYKKKILTYLLFKRCGEKKDANGKPAGAVIGSCSLPMNASLAQAEAAMKIGRFYVVQFTQAKGVTNGTAKLCQVWGLGADGAETGERGTTGSPETAGSSHARRAKSVGRKRSEG